jgi:hypothetical protein
MTSDNEDEAVTLHHTNFAESLKQLLRKSRQLIALQLQRSKFPEAVEEVVG